MIAEVGCRVKVRGSRSATPFVPPSPGRTPTAVPRTNPTITMVMLTGVSATPRPKSRSLKTPSSGIGYRPYRKYSRITPMGRGSKNHRSKMKNNVSGTSTLTATINCQRWRPTSHMYPARMATIGRKTASKDFQAPAGMNGAAPSGVAGARRLCSHTRTAQATTPNVSQKGKNPAPGPALVQRTDSRSASRSRTPAPTTSARALSVSALRITDPPEGKRRGAGKKRLREGPAVDEIGHFRSLHEFPEDVLIIRDRLCRHVLRTKDPAQHLVFDREPEFLPRGDVLPRTDLDALSGQDRQ